MQHWLKSLRTPRWHSNGVFRFKWLLIMQYNPTKQIGISVRVVGYTAIARPLVRVLVDGESVGILKDKQAQIFPVAPGRHTLKVRRDFLRSQVLEFDLSARHPLVEFECGFHDVRLPWLLSLPGHAVIFAVGIAIVVAMKALKLPDYWFLYVLLGLAPVAAATQWWCSYMPAGAHLFIRQITRTTIPR